MKKLLLILVACLFSLLTVSAQCGIENTAFKAGEELNYDLYFNWKFIWVKVGNASLSTSATRYKGQQAYRSSLITRGNGKLDKKLTVKVSAFSESAKAAIEAAGGKAEVV